MKERSERNTSEDLGIGETSDLLDKLKQDRSVARSTARVDSSHRQQGLADRVVMNLRQTTNLIADGSTYGELDSRISLLA
jgi:hypothetical protein